MAKLLIEPLSDNPDALAATENTLSMLPGGGRFVRDDDGELVRKDGLLVLECSNPGFVTFAAIRQGYVRRVCGHPTAKP